VTSEGTAAWTGFQSGNSADDIRSYFPGVAPCPVPGTKRNIPEQDVNSSTIQVTNGEVANAFAAVECIWQHKLGCADTNGDGVPDAAGGEIFTIPIFDLESACTTPIVMNGAKDVVGFATIEITNVANKPPAPREVEVKTRSLTDNTPVLASQCFGTCGVAMVR
jgi:hypothetical protein